MSDASDAGHVTIEIDGRVLSVRAGVPLGAALHAQDRVLRRTARSGEARGLFCGMGLCFDCLVTVNGREGVRACVPPAAEGMRVETGRP